METQTNQPEQKVKEMVETVSKIVPPATVQTPALELRPSKDKAKVMEVARKIKNSERLTDEELIILNEIGDDMDDYIDQLDEYDKSRIQPVTEAGLTEEEFEQVITTKPKEPTKPRPEGEFDITGLRKELMEFIDPGGWEFSDNPSITLVSIATGFLHRRISMTGTNYDKVFPEVPLDTLESLVDHKVISQKTADDFKASLSKDAQGQSAKKTFTHSDLTSTNIDHITKKLKKGDKVAFFAERERTGIWNGGAIIEDKTNNPWSILGILMDVSGWIRIESPAQEQKVKKPEPTSVKPEKNAQKQIIKDLLEYDGNIEKVFIKNGYIKIKGIFVHPSIVDTFNKLDIETIDLLQRNGIVYVDNLSTDGAAGITLGYKYGNQSIMGIGLADIGLFNNPNQIALHELGHVIWEKLSKEQQDMFYDGNPITEHGKHVLNPTGTFKDLYGQGSSYGEEDFAQAFAESKGTLEAVFERKKNKTKPEKETVNAQKELTKQVNKLKNKLVPVQEGGIYLIDGDNRNAYRIVDLALDTVVPLPLSLVDGKLSYDPTLTAGLIKKIVSGYLINDDYIKDTPIEQTISPLEEEDIFSQELLDYIDEIEPDTDVSLEQSNLDKFISGSKIDNTLKSIIDWRLGKGITIDC